MSTSWELQPGSQAPSWLIMKGRFHYQERDGPSLVSSDLSCVFEDLEAAVLSMLHSGCGTLVPTRPALNPGRHAAVLQNVYKPHRMSKALRPLRRRARLTGLCKPRPHLGGAVHDRTWIRRRKAKTLHRQQPYSLPRLGQRRGETVGASNSFLGGLNLKQHDGFGPCHAASPACEQASPQASMYHVKRPAFCAGRCHTEV